MNALTKPSEILNVILIGEPNTGKTVFMYKMATGIFKEEYDTSETTSLTHIAYIGECSKKVIMFDVYDISDRESSIMQQEFYKNADIAILFVDSMSRMKNYLDNAI